MFLTMVLFRLAVTLGGLSMHEGYCQRCPAPPEATQATAARAAQSACLPQPASYRLSLRQTGEGANTLTWPKVTTTENGTVTLAACTQDKKGNAHVWKMLVHHCGTSAGKATFELMVYGQSKGKACKYHTRTVVPLGKEKVLALGGNTPEPLCLSVRAERLPMVSSVVLPNPPKPPTVAVTHSMPLPNPVREYLPPPMPVASWQPVANRTAVMPPPAPVQIAAPACPLQATPNVIHSFPLMVNRPVGQYIPGPAPMLPYQQVPLEGPPMDRRMYVPHIELGQQIVRPVHPVSVTMPAPMPLPMTKTAVLVKEGGKSRVELRGAGTSSKATRLCVEEGLCGKLCLAAGKKYVHVKGEKWKAQAEKVELTRDGRVLLSGHVRLSCDKFGEGSMVKGDKVGLRVQQGRLVELMK